MKVFHTKYFKFSLAALILLLTIQPAWALRLKIATLSPPAALKKIQEGADQIAKETSNRVTFKFYYNMGPDKLVLKKINAGQLHGCFIVGGSLSNHFPANQLYAQPLKFRTLEEIEYVRKHMDEFIINGLANNPDPKKREFITFGLVGGGFSYIMSKNRIETIHDLRNQKVWIPDNDMISQESIKAFGISPIPLPISEVRTGLQTGLINTVANSPIGAIVLQWHTQIKYVVNIPLIYLYAVLAIDKKKFEKISEDDQKIIKKILYKACKQVDTKNKLDEINNINILKKRGIIFITPKPGDLKEWEQVGKIASKKMIDAGILPKDVVEQMDTHLKAYQDTQQATNAK